MSGFLLCLMRLVVQTVMVFLCKYGECTTEAGGGQGGRGGRGWANIIVRTQHAASPQAARGLPVYGRGGERRAAARRGGGAAGGAGASGRSMLRPYDPHACYNPRAGTRPARLRIRP